MKLNSVLTLLFIALFTACKGGAYDLSGYGLKPDTGENASPLIAKALQEIAAEVNSDTVRILLPKGRYDFYPEGASKREYFISNHDQDNPKLVGLAFENMKNVIFDGQGSELVFHGRMLPVSLVGSENCTLKNFSIDFANPHISQVKVLENDTVGGLITYEVAPWVEYESQWKILYCYPHYSEKELSPRFSCAGVPAQSCRSPESLLTAPVYMCPVFLPLVCF